MHSSSPGWVRSHYLAAAPLLAFGSKEALLSLARFALSAPEQRSEPGCTAGDRQNKGKSETHALHSQSRTKNSQLTFQHNTFQPFHFKTSVLHYCQPARRMPNVTTPRHLEKNISITASVQQRGKVLNAGADKAWGAESIPGAQTEGTRAASHRQHAAAPRPGLTHSRTALRAARHRPQPAGTRTPRAGPRATAAPPHLGSRPARAAGPCGRCLAARRHCEESGALRSGEARHAPRGAAGRHLNPARWPQLRAPGGPPAYLPSKPTGSVMSSPGRESIPPPARGPHSQPRLRRLCAQLWRLRWNSNGRNRFRHLCVDGDEAAEGSEEEGRRRAQWERKGAPSLLWVLAGGGRAGAMLVEGSVGRWLPAGRKGGEGWTPSWVREGEATYRAAIFLKPTERRRSWAVIFTEGTASDSECLTLNSRCQTPKLKF